MVYRARECRAVGPPVVERPRPEPARAVELHLAMLVRSSQNYFDSTFSSAACIIFGLSKLCTRQAARTFRSTAGFIREIQAARTFRHGHIVDVLRYA
jgi:hypothetical protein